MVFRDMVFACFTGNNYHRVGVIASGFKVGGSKCKFVAALRKAKFIPICTTTNNKLTLSLLAVRSITLATFSSVETSAVVMANLGIALVTVISTFC
ncbi:hypothetical protein BSPWISOXPB_4031 [uncultured Gammaproteobacteria bacterium]|nr:hypothetical protein BSPWISOXPB_4031 [uncultured Gammaproteobacteria bacterium]